MCKVNDSTETHDTRKKGKPDGYLVVTNQESGTFEMKSLNGDNYVPEKPRSPHGKKKLIY